MYDEALVKYLLLAELGYEVAQSNAAFIMDRKETELYDPEEMWKRALVYWSRYGNKVKLALITPPETKAGLTLTNISHSGRQLKATAQLELGWGTIITTAGGRTRTTRPQQVTTGSPRSNRTTPRPCSTWVICTSLGSA